MKYDFTSVPDRRGKGSSKWNAMKDASPDNVPLSVADMEFNTAPEIRKALKEVADKAVLGYTEATEEYYDAVCGWMKRRHNFDIKPEWIYKTPGVVNALGLLVQAVTEPGDGVILFSPVYYPFDMSILANDRRLVYSELKIVNGRYEIDYDDFAEKAADPDNTALMFCSPHNPVGRVWEREELKKVIDIALDNGLFIIDDEIHNDLIMPGFEHTVLATVNDKVLDNCAVCTAPSKTFNLAGLQCSNIIVPNNRVRAKLNACGMLAMQTHLNIFAYTACTAAYNYGEKWLEQLIGVIQSNAEYIEGFMAENFPEVKVFKLEGTYLQWLDMSGLGMTYREQRAVFEKAGLYFDNGELFGRAGRGYQRINLACAEKTLVNSMKRFKEAVENVRKEWAENGKPYHKTLERGDILENFVYDSCHGLGRNLRDTVTRNTLIVFLRYYECDICRKMMDILKLSYPLFKLINCDIKVVLQSDVDSVRCGQDKYPFELIADPQAELYDKYNVYPADGIVSMIAGDKFFDMFTDGSIRNLLDTDMIDSVIGNATGSDINEVPRQMQVPAFIGVNKNMRIIYSYYGKTIADIPNIKDMIKCLKEKQ